MVTKATFDIYIYICSCSTLSDPMDFCQSPLSIGLSRQEYWRGLPFPPPRYLLDPEIEPVSSAPPALAGRCFTTESSSGFLSYFCLSITDLEVEHKWPKFLRAVHL